MRINISQAFNGIGTVVAPVLGSYVFFLKTADDTQALKNVRLLFNSSPHPKLGLVLTRFGNPRSNGSTSP
jgi:fucose permease